MPENPNELVRATMPSGGEATVRRSYAVKHKLQIKDKPVTRHGGRPVPFKPKVSLPPAGADRVSTNESGVPDPTTGNGDTPPALMS